MSDITIAGATFYGVPSIIVPTVGGGFAEYSEGGSLKPIVLRPDAELVERWEMDEYLVADQGINLPAYSTTAKTLKASVNLTPTIAIDADYSYYVVERLYCKPDYNAETLAKGRYEWFTSAYLYELVEIPANTFKAFNGKAVTSVQRAFAGQGFIRGLYWSSATAVALYTATTYGIAMGMTAPTISGTTATIKTPTELIRGSTTYLTSAMWALITDIRFQYVIEVWRAPKNNLNIDGWGTEQNVLHLMNNVNGDGKLT